MRRINNYALSKFAFCSLTFAICIALSMSCTELEEELTPENAMDQLHPYGSITIISDPPGAAVYLDGENTGAYTDTTFDSVPVGTHTLELLHSEYWGWKQTVVLDACETISINATLYNFFDNFDDIPVGENPSSSIWDVWEEGQGKVAISDTSYGKTNKSCSFTDPDSSSVAAIHTWLWWFEVDDFMSQDFRGTISFIWRINSYGTFGFRTYNSSYASDDFYDWVGVYLRFDDDGYIKSVCRGSDTTSKLIEVCPYIPGNWYAMKIESGYNSYDIYVNGELKVSDVPYLSLHGNVFDMLDFIAFSDAICGKAYVDEVKFRKQEE